MNGHNTKKENKVEVEVEVETRVKACLIEKELQIIVTCLSVATSGWKLGIFTVKNGKFKKILTLQRRTMELFICNSKICVRSLTTFHFRVTN